MNLVKSILLKIYHRIKNCKTMLFSDFFIKAYDLHIMSPNPKTYTFFFIYEAFIEHAKLAN